MALACRICIAERGLRGSEIGSLPQNETELIEHMESFHHMPVVREAETEEAATKRFLAAHPEVRTCPQCAEAGASWAEGTQRT